MWKVALFHLRKCSTPNLILFHFTSALHPLALWRGANKQMLFNYFTYGTPIHNAQKDLVKCAMHKKQSGKGSANVQNISIVCTLGVQYEIQELGEG